MDLSKIAKDLAIPLCLLALVVFLRPYAERLIQINSQIIDLASLTLLIVPAFLGLKFKHFSVFYFVISCLLIFSTLSLVNSSLTHLSIDQKMLISQWLAVLLPLNFLLLKLLRTPGLLTTSSRLFIGILFLEAGFIYWIGKKDEYDLFYFILEPHLTLPISFDSPLSQLAALLFILAVFTQLLVALVKNNSIQANLLGAIIMATIAFYFLDLPHMLAMSVLGLGIMLSIGVTQDSHDMAFIDTLTKLPGRRSMEQELKQLGKNYAIAMLDIDHFKKLNDRYGHDVGDQVLKMVAKNIKRVSGGGKPTRYGGEEFAIIFPGKSLLDVIPHLEAVRLYIEKTPFALRDKDRPKKLPKNANRRSNKTHQNIHVTVSIGAAERNRVNRATESVMKTADDALYRAKRQGRNQVCY